MGITEQVELPTEEELTVTEVTLSAPCLKAGANHYAKYCEHQNNEFVLCKNELKDPRMCIAEGKELTSCALKFFRSVKKTCYDEFMQYAHCIDKSSTDQQLEPCRKTQAVFDKCAKDKLGIERPPYDYFTRVQVHKAKRARPPTEGPTVYSDAPVFLPEDTPTPPPAKYGSRYLFLW